MPCHQKLTVPFPSSALDPTWCPTGSTHGLMLRPPCFIPRTSCTIQPTWTVDRDKCLHHTDDGHDAATELRWSKECSRFWDRQRSAMYELACGLRGEWTNNVELFLANHSLENEACWEITTWIDMARTFTCSPTWTIFSSKSHHSFDKSNTGSARFTRFLGKKKHLFLGEKLFHLNHNQSGTDSKPLKPRHVAKVFAFPLESVQSWACPGCWRKLASGKFPKVSSVLLMVVLKPRIGIRCPVSQGWGW